MSKRHLHQDTPNGCLVQECDSFTSRNSNLESLHRIDDSMSAKTICSLTHTVTSETCFMTVSSTVNDVQNDSIGLERLLIRELESRNNIHWSNMKQDKHFQQLLKKATYIHCDATDYDEPFDHDVTFDQFFSRRHSVSGSQSYCANRLSKPCHSQ